MHHILYGLALVLLLIVGLTNPRFVGYAGLGAAAVSGLWIYFSLRHTALASASAGAIVGDSDSSLAGAAGSFPSGFHGGSAHGASASSDGAACHSTGDGGGHGCA